MGIEIGDRGMGERKSGTVEIASGKQIEIENIKSEKTTEMFKISKGSHMKYGEKTQSIQIARVCVAYFYFSSAHKSE